MRRGKRLPLATLAALVVCPARARADGAGPNRIVVQPDERASVLEVARWGGHVGLGVRGASSRSESASQTSDLGILEERVGLDLRGSVYDRRFVTYDLGAEVGLLQGWFDGPRGDDRIDSQTLRYRGLLRVLPMHADSADLSASRSDEFLLPLFGRPERREVMSFQSVLRHRGAIDATARASYEDTRARRAGAGQIRDDAALRLGFQAINRDDDRGHLRLEYDFEDRDDRLWGFDERTHTASLSHRVDWDGERQQLGSSLWLTDRDSRVAFTQGQWLEDYRYSPMEELALTAAGRGVYSRNELDTRRSLSSNLGARHRLYQSLRTGASVQAARDWYDDGAQLTWGGGASVDYTKRLPLAQVRAGYSVSWTRTDRDLGTRSRLVLDEPHTLLDATIVLLDNLEVDPISVVVRDAATRTPYAAGLDYDLQPLGLQTRVVRRPGGSIADGQAVLVEYRFAQGGRLEFDSTAHTAHGSVTVLEVVRPYYDLLLIRPDVRHEPAAGVSSPPVTATEQRYGVEATWRWVRARLERQEVQRSSGSFRGWSADGALGFEPHAALRVQLHGSHHDTQFANGRTRLNLAALRLSWWPADGLESTLEVGYESARGLGADRRAVTVRGNATYRMGRLELGLDTYYRHSEEARVGWLDEFQVGFQVVRRF